MTDPRSQPPGSYGPQGGPPAPPPYGLPQAPKKSRGWLVPVLIGGGLVVALCCGGGVLIAMAGGDKPAATVSAGETTEPADQGGSADQDAKEEQADAPAGPPSAKVGETITISGGLTGGDEMAFTVRSVKPASSDNMFTQPGAGKKYVSVDISVLMKKGEALMTGNEITLQGKDGEVYTNQFVVHDDAFEWAKLSSGQRKSGLVFFEVPKAFAIKDAKVLVQDFWDSKPAGQWVL